MGAAIIGALALAMSSLVGRVLLALSLSYVTYTGFSSLGSYALTEIKSSFSGMGADAVGLLGYLWVDKAMSLIFSAYTTALAFKTAGGALTKLVRK